MDKRAPRQDLPEKDGPLSAPLYPVVMHGVTEYTEEFPVEIVGASGRYDPCVQEEQQEGHGRLAVRAECGYGAVEIDLEELLRWTAANLTDTYCRCGASEKGIIAQ